MVQRTANMENLSMVKAKKLLNSGGIQLDAPGIMSVTSVHGRLWQNPEQDQPDPAKRHYEHG
jgi:hypothetical protein